jgi:hypothetical protein
MINLNDEVKDELIKLASEKNVFLEGNISKCIRTEPNTKFEEYINQCILEDKSKCKKRLNITKKIQEQNRELVDWKVHNEQLNAKLQSALETSEKAKQIAENDLDILQKKTQNELVGSIVKVALWIICGVGTVTSILFATTLITGIDNKTVESSWSNMFSILLTNSFSIVGTIMGVKYAGGKSRGKCDHCKKC